MLVTFEAWKCKPWGGGGLHVQLGLQVCAFLLGAEPRGAGGGAPGGGGAALRLHGAAWGPRAGAGGLGAETRRQADGYGGRGLGLKRTSGAQAQKKQTFT